jgi:DNA-binding MarR family transcriptional regulator
MTGDLAARFVEAGVEITVEQWRALIPLIKLDGLTQGKLCEILSQEKTGVSRLVAALEKRGFVRREASKQDRRIKHVFITDSGRELVEFTLDMAIKSREDRIEHIDPEDLAICKQVLWKIIAPTLNDDFLTRELTNSRE